MTSAAALQQTINTPSVCGAEEWRGVPDFRAYEVSNLGRVRRVVGGKGAVQGRILKPIRSSSGHLSVVLHTEGRRCKQQVHRLVAKTFIGPPPSLDLRVLHGDDNPENNTPDNLRWGTSKENAADRKLNRGWHNLKGSNNPAAILSEREVNAIRVGLAIGVCGSCLGRIFGVSKETIYSIRNGRTWSKVEEVR